MQQVSAALIGVVVGHLIGFSAWPVAAAVAAMGCISLLLWLTCFALGEKAVPARELTQIKEYPRVQADSL